FGCSLSWIGTLVFSLPLSPFPASPCKGGPNARKSAWQEKQDRPRDRLGGPRSPSAGWQILWVSNLCPAVLVSRLSCPRSPTAEAAALGAVQCGFESRRGY